MAHQPLSDVSAPAYERCLLEAGFPWGDVSRLVQSDRAYADPVYSAHKWWARRPRALIRALIIAAHLPGSSDGEAFWKAFADSQTPLAGRHVGDCFHGGGTTVVEAARLGAKATGIDVDPLAERILRDQLSTVSSDSVEEAGQDLVASLAAELGDLYPEVDADTEPLHYFRLRRVSCAACDHDSLMYRSLVLARDTGRIGAVVRDGMQTAFCPSCCALHELGLDAEGLTCCGEYRPLATSTFSRAGYRCPDCANVQGLAALQPALATEELIAVEDTVEGGHRQLREPTPEDDVALGRAATERKVLESALPQQSLAGVDGDRPWSYGFRTVSQLFGDRQALLFHSALRWLGEASLDAGVRARLALGVSNAISSNNRLCGYATDYGRLAPAFTGVRSYALPIVAVEINALHPRAGRGTLPATFRRLRRSAATTTHRRVHPLVTTPAQEMVARVEATTHVECQTAERPFPSELGACSAIITDPPYYDFIAYSDLSLLHRAWLGDAERLAGAPIYPVGSDGHETFVRRLGRALRTAAAALEPDAVLAFTYHSPRPQAWQALAQAVKHATLHVTSVFPVWADARSSTSHGHPGSCEWDLVWVCRRGAGAGAGLPESVEDWASELTTFEVGSGDQTSMRLGLRAAQLANDRQLETVALSDFAADRPSVRDSNEAQVT